MKNQVKLLRLSIFYPLDINYSHSRRLIYILYNPRAVLKESPPFIPLSWISFISNSTLLRSAIFSSSISFYIFWAWELSFKFLVTTTSKLYNRRSARSNCPIPLIILANCNLIFIKLMWFELYLLSAILRPASSSGRANENCLFW